jgi:hypothetical protein
MAYEIALLEQIERWVDSGILPIPSCGERIVELGSQQLVRGISHDAVVKFIRKFRPDSDAAEVSAPLPVNYYGAIYVDEIWHRCGLDYISYDVVEAPRSRVFDLNFHQVPSADQQSALFVTNIGTTEHLANQLNAFRTVHDLLKVGGVAIHAVPFTGMFNHSLFNYHPKFFFSLIVNNCYRLRHVEFRGPGLHAAWDPGNTIFDGDYLTHHPRLPGSEAWSAITLHSGMIYLIIERRHPDAFVPPVDFASGYFGDIPTGDLSALVGVDELPANAWADAYRRGVTPSQQELVPQSTSTSHLSSE